MGTYRKIDDFSQLPRGTIIKHALDERTFVVTGNYGNRVIAVATVDVTNLSEWQVFDTSDTDGYIAGHSD